MNKQLPIWGNQIPYNHTGSKLPDLPRCKGTNATWAMLRFVFSLSGEQFRDIRKLANRFTYLAEIRTGHEKETYEDVPHLVPYLVPHSNRAVIIVPGGGYAYKSSDFDAKGSEGAAIAIKLNEHGINAFILWYRSNPYYMPIPLLDAQRAIRWLRYNAASYGIDPERIGMIGFSAGGMQVCGALNILRNAPVNAPGYNADSIDAVSAHLNCAALIYPCINFRYTQPMMCTSFPYKDLADPATRTKILDTYDNTRFVQEGDPPQFICYGTKDTSVNFIQSLQYIDALNKKQVPHQSLAVVGAGHGFGACEIGYTAKHAYWIDEYLNWLDQVL